MRPHPKPQTPRSDPYKIWIRTQPCVNCGRYANEYLDVVPMHGRTAGTAIKGSDFEILPGCVSCHEAEHRRRKLFWEVVKERTGYTRAELVAIHRRRYEQALSGAA